MRVPAFRAVFSPSDREEIHRRVEIALLSGSLTLGPNTAEFESAFAARHSAPLAIATSSGTSALEIILRSIDIVGKEVIVPSNTFFATAAAVVHAGGTPRFADIDPDTLCLSPETVLQACSSRTSGVILVHIGGPIAPSAEPLAALCRERGWWLVEDAAHAHGSSREGRHAGHFGVAAAFSFYPTKVITAGEGGMILTADETLAQRALSYRDQGKAAFHGTDHVTMGSAWRMSELHAAVGLVHLRRLDEFIERRSSIAAVYRDALSGNGALSVAPHGAVGVSNHYKFVAQLARGIDRATFKAAVRAKGVEPSGEVYASPLHRQPIFRQYAWGDLPVTDEVCARQVCFPVHSDMSDDEVAFVTQVLDEVAASCD